MWSKGDDQTATTRRLALDDRKDKFEELNTLAHACGDAWLISVPGDFEIIVECLPDSTMPDRLRRLDYQLRDEGTGERILAHAIKTPMTLNADGTMSPLTEGSTQAVTIKVTHAGIVRTERWSFLI
jgi:hypothetical protein